MVISGAGARQTIVDGNGTTRLFTISQGAQVAFSALTVQEGFSTQQAGPGGNILVNLGATLGLTQVRVRAGNANQGGGVANFGTLTLAFSLFDGNTAQVSGGAIFNSPVDGPASVNAKGRYSAATVRGKKWLVQDTCAGTLTRVTQGAVTVRDDVRKRTIVLRKGKRYLARPR